MHPLLWQLLQLLIHEARALHSPEEEMHAAYTRGQVSLIMCATGLSGDKIYEILTETITHNTGEIDALVKLQRLVCP